MSEPAIVRNPDGSLTFHRIPRSLSEAVDMLDSTDLDDVRPVGLYQALPAAHPHPIPKPLSRVVVWQREGAAHKTVHTVPHDSVLAAADRAWNMQRDGVMSQRERDAVRSLTEHGVRLDGMPTSGSLRRLATRRAPTLRYGQPWWKVARPPYNQPPNRSTT